MGYSSPAERNTLPPEKTKNILELKKNSTSPAMFEILVLHNKYQRNSARKEKRQFSWKDFMSQTPISGCLVIHIIYEAFK